MPVNYQIQRSKRKTIAIMINKDSQVIVKAPYFADNFSINNFVQKKENWINKKLQEKQEIDKQFKKKEFVDGEKFYYLGKEYKLVLGENIPGKLKFQNNLFYLDKNYTNQGKKLFENWYINKFKEDILPRIENFAKKYNFNYNKISIKNLKSKWGSCNSRNDLVFNCRLMMAPIEIIDYVLVHELCHTIEKNHSHRFWSLVSSIMPQYKSHKKRLKENGVYLYF